MTKYQIIREIERGVHELRTMEEKEKDNYSEWIICSDGYYPVCKECHYEPKEMTRYCPNCGRTMTNFGGITIKY